MSSASKIIQAAAGAGGEALYVEDVFSTYLYDGTGSSLTITNDIDLDGEGGLVWTKSRSGAYDHAIMDTVRGVAGTGGFLESNTTNAAETGFGSDYGPTSYNSNGYTLGSSGSPFNASGVTYASWTFRKAPKFFDVVTYTGTGSATTVSHNLGSVPGCIMVKRTDTTGDWQVYHRANTANPETDYLELNDTAATADDNTMWNDTAPTSTEFTVGTNNDVNASTATYVAYLFAHNNGDGEFGESGDQDIIKCGSYTGNGSNDGPEVDLGFEPQWLLVKRTDNIASWYLMDVMRGIPVGSGSQILMPNASDAEFEENPIAAPQPTGFQITDSSAIVNASGGNYIYIAIRRGPMKTPESGTEVFAVDLGSSSGNVITTGFPIDLQIYNFKNGDAGNSSALDRLRGFSSTSTESGRKLVTSAVNVESAGLTEKWTNTGFTETSAYGSPSTIYWNFRRAPGFFDVVAYTGTGSATTISHNLGVVPELIIVKNRDQSDAWQVYTGDETDYLVLNTNAATADNVDRWNDTAPTDSVFTIGTAAEVNTSTEDYIAYLFATLPGISKVGSYTGNGTSQTIDCGFSAGARFVMTKRVNTTGNWNVWDSERGIVAGNDPRLELNTTDAEDTGHDYIDPDNSGFVVNYVADDDDDSNVSGDEYIFLAIA